MSLSTLREDSALRFDESSCLPLRSIYGQCRACAHVCPRGVLKVSVESVALEPGCIDCGRCVAVCPTQALALADVDALDPPDSGEAIRIECFKVPPKRLLPGTIRVPCCGSVSVGRLLELAARQPDTVIAVVDRGWCASCNAGGGGAHPARRSVDEATQWLESVGTASQWLPRIEREDLDIEDMPEAIPRAREEPMPGNRAFAAVLEKAPERARSVPSPMGADGMPGHPASERRASPERQRQIEAIYRLAARNGTHVPSELFPHLWQSGACVDHRICVALCPTGALSVETGPGVAVLTVNGSTCIACGSCARGCPESALVVAAHGGHRGVVEIAQHHPRNCDQCGAEYTSRDAEELLCAWCSKAQQFVDGILGRAGRSNN